MQDSRAVDSEAMSVIGNYKGSSTKQKSVTGQLREIIFLNHGEQLVNFFSTSSRSTPSSLPNYEIIKFLKIVFLNHGQQLFNFFVSANSLSKRLHVTFVHSQSLFALLSCGSCSLFPLIFKQLLLCRSFCA